MNADVGEVYTMSLATEEKIDYCNLSKQLDLYTQNPKMTLPRTDDTGRLFMDRGNTRGAREV
jgi:hypothetical protein